MSHIQINDLSGISDFIQEYTSVPICLDTEGAQVPNGPLEGNEVMLDEQVTARAEKWNHPGNDKCFSFYPDFVVDLLKVSDLISIEFDSV